MMRATVYNRLWVLVGALALLIAINGCAAKKILIVDPLGHGDERTISAAMKKWKEGQTLEVRPGVYDERLLLRANMTIKGAGADRAILRYSGDGPALTGSDVSNVKISGLGIEHGGQNKGQLVVLSSTDIEFERCRISKSLGSGIEAQKFGQLRLVGTEVSQNGENGIYLHDDARAELIDSTLTQNQVGLKIDRFPLGRAARKEGHRSQCGRRVVAQNDDQRKHVFRRRAR